ANSDVKNSSIHGKTYLQTLHLIKEGLTIPEIAKARNIHETTVYSHLAYLIEKQLIQDIKKYLSKEEMELIDGAVKATGIDDALKPLYDHMEEKIDYGKIRLFLSYKKMNEK
ncbi:MAG: helix-turn-helix domain-containing protein, partial [Cyclobacteriaceae bacterium]|nr:helix-turn-helix domain-containing protein [Cyclobacteriaceae bacterium]